MIIRHLLAGLVLLGCLSATPSSAAAAESYDNCTGFIDSLPASISRKDLNTAMSSGVAR